MVVPCHSLTFLIDGQLHFKDRDRGSHFVAILQELAPRAKSASRSPHYNNIKAVVTVSKLIRVKVDLQWYQYKNSSSAYEGMTVP